MESKCSLARRVMQRTPWFASFDSETLERFLNEGRYVNLHRGEVLCRQGDVVSTVCVVIDGTLDVSFMTAQGKRHIVTHLEPGQLMNLIPVMDGQRAIHNAYAHENAIALLLPGALFREAVSAQPGPSAAMMRLLCLRSRLLYESVSDSALLSLRERCARLLLSLMSSYGLPREYGVAISLKLSQDELADMLGRTRQGVNKELKLLEREGIIEMTYSHFIVRDPQALSKIVESVL